MNWFRRLTSNVFGFIVVSEAAFSLPLCVALLHQDYLDGTLSRSQAFRDISACIIGGVLFALAFWYTVARPLRKRTRNDQNP